MAREHWGGGGKRRVSSCLRPRVTRCRSRCCPLIRFGNAHLQFGNASLARVAHEDDLDVVVRCKRERMVLHPRTPPNIAQDEHRHSHRRGDSCVGRPRSKAHGRATLFDTLSVVERQKYKYFYGPFPTAFFSASWLRSSVVSVLISLISGTVTIGCLDIN